MKECVIDKRVAFGLQKHSIFTDKFSSVIQRLQEAGLINKWVEDELEIAQEKARKRASLSSSPTDSTDQGPKAWTMGELDLPFYILLSMLAMCFLCFAGEVSFGKIFFSGLKAV